MVNLKKIDHNLSMSYTDTHIYFLNGPFSQWFPSKFKDSYGVEYNCCEQYMMANKAKVFGDFDILGEIMEAESPRLQKSLGRKVKNFDEIEWNKYNEQIVVRGNFHKFTQNKNLRNFMIGTEDKILVEGAWYDHIWGVGLAWNDPMILDEKNWNGKNLLGKSLMIVREKLRIM